MNKLLFKVFSIFVILVIINSFISWSEPAWLNILPFVNQTLINPQIDIIIKYLAYLLLAIQIPILVFIDVIEKFYTFNTINAILFTSLLSTGLFLIYFWLWKQASKLIKKLS